MSVRPQKSHWLLVLALLATLVVVPVVGIPQAVAAPLTGDGLIAFPRNSSNSLWGTSPSDTATVSNAGGNVTTLFPGTPDVRYPSVDAAGNIYFYMASGVSANDGFYKATLNGSGTYDTPTQIISRTSIISKCSALSVQCTYVNWMPASISPDGNWLLFASGIPSSSSAYGIVTSVMLLKLADLSMQKVVSDPYSASDSPNDAITAAWRRDGLQFAFARRVSRNSTNLTSVGGLYTVDFNPATGTFGTPLQQTSDTSYSGYQHQAPTYAPDGSFLLFSDQSAQHNAINKVILRLSAADPINSVTTLISRRGLSLGSPKFSPSGDYLLFTANVNGNDFPGGSGDVWIANSDGSAARLLRYVAPNTCGGQDALTAIWLPSATDRLSGPLTPMSYTPPALSFSSASYSLVRNVADTGTASVSNTGGTPQYWAVSPSLPNGLSLNCAGAITGTPSSVSAATVYTVTGYLGTDSSTASTTIAITDKPATVSSVTPEPGNGQVRLFWSPPAANGSSITDYVIEYKLDTATSWTTFADGTNTLTTVDVTGLTNGLLYNFRVSAKNAVGTGTASAVVKQTPGVPLQVIGLVLGSGNARLTASWTAPSDNGSPITGYTVQYATSSGGTYTTFSRSNALALSETVTGLTNSATYFVKVTAVNANGAGAASAISSIKVGLAGKPLNFRLDTYTATTVKLLWDAPTQTGSGITAYKVRQRVLPSGSWSTPVSAGATTTYTYTSLSAGSAYEFAVLAVTAAGDGEYTDTITATPRGVPAAPSLHTMTAVAGEMTLGWTAPSTNGSPITDYTIRYKKASESTWTEVSKGAATTGYVVSGLQAATSYNFGVRAVNGEGAGAWSSSGTATSGSAPTVTAVVWSSGSRGPGGTFYISGTSFSATSTLTIDGNVITITSRTLPTRLFFTLPAGTGTVPVVVTTGGLSNAPFSYTYLPEISSLSPQGASSTGGTQITITGTGFTNSSTVKFGSSVAAGFTYDSATQVRVTLPSATARATSSVTITTTAGTSIGVDYAYDSPTLTSISPSTGSTVGGTTITLTGTQFAAGATVSVGGVSATSVTVVSATSITAITPAGSGAASVTVTRNGLTTAGQTFTYVGPPLAISTDTATASSGAVILQWVPPVDGGSAITGYDVEYRAVNSPVWESWTAVTSNASADSTTVTGLTNAVTYEFRIRAKNINGVAPWGETLTATPATAPSTPDAPTATPGNASVGLAWVAPANGGSSITGFDVQYRLFGAGGWTAWTSESTTASASGTIVTDLINGNAYEFQVRAKNLLGDSAWSTTALSTPDAVPLQITSVNVAEAASQVQLTWNTPGDGGSPITGFDVEYRALGAAAWDAWSAESSTATAVGTVITGLTDGTTYEFQVRARNGVGVGIWSSIALGTPRTVPSQVTGVTATPADSQITVAWTAPSSGGSSITGYDLRHAVAGSGSWTTLSLGATTFSEVIGTLVNGTAYDFQVRALNVLGDGPWSALVSATAGVAQSSQGTQSSNQPATTTSTGSAGFSPRAPSVTVTPARVVPGGRFQITATISCAAPMALTSRRFPPTMYYLAGTAPLINGVYGTAVIDGSSASWTITATAPLAEGAYRVQVYGRDNPSGVNCTGSTSSFSWSSDGTLTVAKSSAASANVSDTSTAVVTVPRQVVGLITRQTGTSFTLSWSQVTAVSDYLIEYSASGGPWTVLNDGVSTSTSFSGALPANSGTVAFRVSAINDAGTGPASSPSTVTVGASSAPSGVRISPSMSISAASVGGGQEISLQASIICPAPMSKTSGNLWPSMYYMIWSSPYVNDVYRGDPTLSADGKTATWTVTVPAPLKAGRYRVQAYGRDNPAGVACMGDTYQFNYSASDLWLTVSTTTAVAPETTTGMTQQSATPSQITQSVSTPVTLGGPVVTADVAIAVPGVVVGVEPTATSDGTKSITFSVPSIDVGTVVVADGFVGNIPGVRDIVVKPGGLVTITLQSTYSGVLAIPLVGSTLTEAGMFSTLQVAVAPDRVAKAEISRLSRNSSTVAWTLAPNEGLTYSVLVDGKSVCTTQTNSCRVGQLLGPANLVKVVAVDASNVAAAPRTATLANRGMFSVGKVTFSKGRTSLSSAAKTDLAALTRTLRQAGYTAVRVYGYSSENRSSVVARTLSMARAKAVATQLRKSAPWLRVTVQAKGATNLVNSNLTEVQRQANRRATVVIQLG